MPPVTTAPADTPAQDEQTRMGAHWASQERLLDERYASEQRDEGWATRLERDYEQAFQVGDEDEPAIVLTEVNCRSTLCQLRLDLLITEDPIASVTNAMVKMPGQAERFIVVTGDDPPSVRLFVARDGMELPHAPPPPNAAGSAS